MGSTRTTPALFGFYFLALLAVALLVRDVPGQLDPFATTLADILAKSQWGDPVSYAGAATEIAASGWGGPVSGGVFRLWPPGLVVLEAGIVTLFGDDAPVILILQILVAALLAAVFVVQRGLLARNLPSWLATALPLVLLLFPVARVYLLQPTFVTFGATFAVGFFLLFVVLALRGFASGSVIAALGAGVSLGLSAYFRSQFEILVMVATAWGLVAIVGAWAFRRSRHVSRAHVSRASALRAIRTVGLVLVAAQLIMAPWRAYQYEATGTLKWVQTSDIEYRNSVTTSEALSSGGAGFIVVGAGNLTCRIDETTCGRLDEAEALFFSTFLGHPVEWLSLKAEVLDIYWFAGVDYVANAGAGSVTPSSYAWNGAILVLLAVLVLILLTPRARRHEHWFVLAWVLLSLSSAYAVIFTLAHYEVRYFHFPKIATVFFTLLALATLARRRGERPG